MAKKRTHFKLATLEASTDTHRNILAKRLVMIVKYVSGVNPQILSVEPTSIKTKEY
jgi:hypothetical protein